MWLTPDREETLSVLQLSRRIGISASSMHRRLAIYGPDSCLTYWPGPIPGHLRAYSTTATSTIKSIKRGTLLKSSEVDHRSARLLILKLILRSREDLVKYDCKSSYEFLTNKHGMLEWYLELMFSAETVVGYIERLQAFVREHSQIESKLSENATDFSDLAN